MKIDGKMMLLMIVVVVDDDDVHAVGKKRLMREGKEKIYVGSNNKTVKKCVTGDIIFFLGRRRDSVPFISFFLYQQ